MAGSAGSGQHALRRTAVFHISLARGQLRPVPSIARLGKQNGSGLDFHLHQATAPGATLGAPYDHDPDGKLRGADGTWDRGAFEYAP